MKPCSSLQAAFFVQRRQYGTKNKQGDPGIPGGDVLGADTASVPFFCFGTWYIRRDIFSAAGKARHGGCVMGMYLRDAALRDARLCDLQQNARREIPLGSDQDGTIDAKKTDLQAEEPVLCAFRVCRAGRASNVR